MPTSKQVHPGLHVLTIIFAVLQAIAFWVIIPPDFIVNPPLGSLIIFAGLFLLTATIVLAIVGRKDRAGRFIGLSVGALVVSQVGTLVVLYVVNNS